MHQRDRIVSALAQRLMAVDVGHPVRVGIDGPCGSGKTTLARELVAAITVRGRNALHLDSDGFHHPQHVRHRQGRDSARGYYEDAYDFSGLVDRVLIPLGPKGSRVYATKLHDLTSDKTLTDLVATAPDDAVVVFDCTFLQRGVLRDHWDEVIYLEVRREVAVARGAARDAASLGGIDRARAAYDARYMAACDIYLREERPTERASMVIDLNDAEEPRVLRGF